MAKDFNGNIGSDPTLLLVSGNKGGKSSKEDETKYVKKLANAAIQTFNKHNTVKFRGVGHCAVGRAIKASIITKGEVLKRGDRILLDPSFVVVNFNGEEKTGILIEIVKVNRGKNIVV
jgi:stage V sporulation protein SpoVS